MNAVLPNGEPVEVVRPGWTTDRYGNRVPDWANATRTTYDYSIAYPGTTAENVVGREDGVEVELVLLLPYGADVASTDHVVFRGEEFEVVGDAYDWRSPLTNWMPGTEVALRSYDG